RSKDGAIYVSHKIPPAISPAPRDAWAQILQASPAALAFHTPTWLDCLCEVAGYVDASRLYALGNGRYAVLPLVRRRGLPVPVTMEASWPFGWGFGGAVAPGTLTPEDVGGILADLARRRHLLTSVRPDPLSAAAWMAATPGTPGTPATTQRLAHILDLEGG